MAVHRMVICMEVPAVDGMDKVSLVGFPDLLKYIGALVERTKEECEGRIADASYKVSYEWDKPPELDVALRAS